MEKHLEVPMQRHTGSGRDWATIPRWMEAWAWPQGRGLPPSPPLTLLTLVRKQALSPRTPCLGCHKIMTRQITQSDGERHKLKGRSTVQSQTWRRDWSHQTSHDVHRERVQGKINRGKVLMRPSLGKTMCQLPRVLLT